MKTRRSQFETGSRKVAEWLFVVGEMFDSLMRQAGRLKQRKEIEMTDEIYLHETTFPMEL